MADLDYNRISMLSQEAQQLVQALINFDGGGRIVNMTVAPPPFDANNPNVDMPAMVQTSDIDYPPQMVDAIRAALNDRYSQVSAELVELLATQR